MRFKAKLATDQVAALSNVVTPISKLQDGSKGAVLYLDPEFLRISCQSDSGITCFAELSNSRVFMEHRIESAAENVIVCQLDLVSLKLALQSVLPSSQGKRQFSGRGAVLTSTRNHHGSSSNNTGQLQSLLTQQTVILKLAKRSGVPCLCLDGRATQEGAVEIHQAIPIRVLRSSEMQYHLPPQINTPQVQLELPLDRPIRGIVDKLKAMGPHIYLEASMKGDLTIRLDHDGASLACYYNNLNPRWDQESGQAPNLDSSCVLKVDGQKLSQCLQWQQIHVPITSCLVGMVHNEMLVLHVLLHPEQMGFFTYYLPVHYLSEDDMQAVNWT